jgi:hypothetical protein
MQQDTTSRFRLREVVDFLSDEWLEALDAAATSSPSSGTGDDRLVVQQVVTDDERGDRAYYIEVRDGGVRVRRGLAAKPTLRFTTDRPTATAIARGDESAQAAFIQGRLRVGGDTRALTVHADVLARLDELFAPVRSTTVY